jgi:hypothetical protein
MKLFNVNYVNREDLNANVIYRKPQIWHAHIEIK